VTSINTFKFELKRTIGSYLISRAVGYNGDNSAKELDISWPSGYYFSIVTMGTQRKSGTLLELQIIIDSVDSLNYIAQ
jgi:hypothetical protein